MEVRIINKRQDTKKFRRWGSIIFDVTVAELQWLIACKKAGLRRGLCAPHENQRGIIRRKVCTICVKD